MSGGSGDVVTTVLFDVGLTLLRAEPSFVDVFAAGCERAGVRVDAQRLIGDDGGEGFGAIWVDHSATWRAGGNVSPHVGDEVAERGFWVGLYGRLLSYLEVDDPEGRVATHVHEAFLAPGAFGPFPETREVLDDLRARGVRLGVVSNWGTWLRTVLDEVGVAGHFDEVVVSGEETVEKPDPAIFRTALERLGETPGPHVAHVGDDVRADVAPADALGLRSVLIDRWGRHAGHEGTRITDLRQLADVLPLPPRPGVAPTSTPPQARR